MNPPENETTTQAQSSEAVNSAETAASNQEASLSMSQVQAMIEQAVQKTRDATFAEARRTFEGKKPKAPTKEESRSGTAEPSMNELLQLRDTFDDSIESVRFPNKKAKAKMREEFLSTRPQDASAWIADYADTMGWSPSAQTQEQTKPKPLNAHPRSDAGSPASTTMGERSTDVMSWTNEDFYADFRAKAKVPSNLYNIQNRDYVKSIRRQAEASMANKTFYTGPERK